MKAEKDQLPVFVLHFLKWFCPEDLFEEIEGDRWLKGFAYRTDMSWWVFALVGFAVMVMAFVTICFQAIKSALANPVVSLQTE